MRLAVTGGAGFIGGHFVERLAATRPGRILVIDNLSRACMVEPEFGLADVMFTRVDIRNRAAVRDALTGCDIVFHLAAQSNVIGAVRNAQYAFDTNVRGTFNVLEAAKHAGVKRFVFTSSREVYGEPDRLPVQESSPANPKNGYGVSKLAGEFYCRLAAAEGLETVILRLANVYGPRDRDRVIPLFINAARNGSQLTVYGGQQLLDFVWIETVLDALMKAGFDRWVEEPVNIGSGTGTTVLELAKRINSFFGSDSPIRILPARGVEVSRFVADIRQAQRFWKLPTPTDPLMYLSQLAGTPDRSLTVFA